MFRYMIGALAILLTTITQIIAKDVNYQIGNFALSVLGKSGKITLGYKTDSTLTLELSSLIEKLPNGNPIDTTSAKTHSFSTFSALDFVVTDFVKTTCGTLSCFRTTLKATNFFTTSTIEGVIDFFDVAGDYDLGNNVKQSVKIGSVRLSFNLNTWKFCKNTGNVATDEAVCNNADKTFVTNSLLELAVVLKGKAKGTTTTANRLFTFGDSTATLYDTYSIDDKSTKFASNFPNLDYITDKDTLFLRFEKFQNTLKYDSVFLGLNYVDPIPKDVSKTLGNFSLKVSGKSGKIELGYKTESTLTIELASLIEKLPTGVAIDVSTPKTHSFTDFTNLIFEVSDFVQTTSSNLSCYRTSFKATNFLGTSTLEGIVDFFDQSGSILIESPLSQTIKRGSIKLTYNLSNWKFCKNTGVVATDEAVCNNADKTFITNSLLDLALVVKGKTAGTSTSTNKVYSFGDSVGSFFDSYLVDNNLTKFSADFPKLEADKNMLSLRFNRFEKTLNYESMYLSLNYDEPLPVVARNVFLTVDNSTMKVYGKSGKIELGYLTNSTFSFELASLVEKLPTGVSIDSTDPAVAKTHTFTDFSNLVFELTDFVKTVCSNVSCYLSTLKARNFFGTSTLEGLINFFDQTGEIDLGNNLKQTVTRGTVRLSFNLNTWKFCKNTGVVATDEAVCNNADKTFITNSLLDLSVVVKGNSKGITTTANKLYTFGDSTATLTDSYIIDDKSTKFAANYPNLVSVGDKDTLNVRFEKFQNTLQWDPILLFLNPVPVVPVVPVVVDKVLTQSVGNYTLDLLGKSGKVALKFNNETRLTLEFASLIEKTLNGSAIDTQSSRNHTFDNFANTIFDLSDFKNSTFKNLTCLTSDIKVSNFLKNATLLANLYLFTQDGKVDTGNQVYENVSSGSLKLSFTVANWPFCNNTGDAVKDDPLCSVNGTKIDNSVLDFSVLLKGKNANSVANCTRQELNKTQLSTSCLFDDVKATFSPYYLVDNVTKTMPAGFPNVNTTGNKNLFNFRFEKFPASAVWDPVFQVNFNNTNPTPTPSPANPDQVYQTTEILLDSKGGKMNFLYKSPDNLTTNNFNISFVSVIEYDTDNNVIEAANHAVTNLSELNFTVGEFKETQFQKLNVSVLEFKTKLVGDSLLTSKIYYFEQNGEILVGTEKVLVEEGDVKFDVQIDKWNFCTVQINNTNNNNITTGTCATKNTSYQKGVNLEVKLKVKEISKSEKKYDTLFVYGQSFFKVPSAFSIDGKDSDMVSGFPRFENVDNFDYYTLRFPVFADTVKYDPLITFRPVKSGSPVVIVIILLLVLLLAVALVCYCRKRGERRYSASIEKRGNFVDV